MYYRKYFEGTVHAWTDGDLPNWKFRVRGDKTADSERDLSYDSTVRSINQYRSNIIGNALASTLRDCGFDAVYSKGYLYFDYSNSDVGIYVWYGVNGFVTALPGQDNVNENDIIVGLYNYTSNWSSTYSTYARDYGIFYIGGNVSSAYRCAITVKGETTGFVRISIGTYSNVAVENQAGNVFYISRFVDTRNNKNVWGLHYGSGSNTNSEFGGSNLPGQIHPIYEDNLLPVYQDISSSSSGLTIRYSATEELPNITTKYNDKLLPQEHRSGTIYTLIDTFLNSHSPFVKGKNIFIKIDGLTSQYFYDFDGDIYYVEKYACTKCVTQVVPTPADIDDGYIEETNNG